MNSIELETAKKDNVIQVRFAWKKQNSVMRPRSGIGLKFGIGQLNDSPAKIFKRNVCGFEEVCSKDGNFATG